MKFRELIERLSRRIGHHQIPVNPVASELRGFIDSGAVHYELVTQAVTAIYTGNRCRSLADPVTREATFEALGPIRLAVQRSPRTDVDAWQLMESLCHEVARAFAQAAPTATPITAVPGIRSAQLVRFRRRLRF